MPGSVTFDGPNKRIIIDSGSTSLNIKTDIYSDWKVWAKTDDNSKYLQAMRSTGGDPLVGGTSLDGYFFLLNGWQLVPPTDGGVDDIVLEGNLYVDGGGNLFDVSGSGVRLVQQDISSKATVEVEQLPVTASVTVTASFAGADITSSLTPAQETMLLELYRVYGLDPTRPLIVSPTDRFAGPEISQSISVTGSTYTAQRL